MITSGTVLESGDWTVGPLDTEADAAGALGALDFLVVNSGWEMVI